MGTTWGQPIDFWKGELEGPAEKGKTPNSISSVVATDPSLIFSNLRVTRLFYPVILVLSDGVLVHWCYWCGTGESFFVHCWCPVGVLSLTVPINQVQPLPKPVDFVPNPRRILLSLRAIIIPALLHPSLSSNYSIKAGGHFTRAWVVSPLWVVGSHRWMEGRSARPQMDQIAVAPI